MHNTVAEVFAQDSSIVGAPPDAAILGWIRPWQDSDGGSSGPSHLYLASVISLYAMLKSVASSDLQRPRNPGECFVVAADNPHPNRRPEGTRPCAQGEGHWPRGVAPQAE